ncbi:MAG: YSIRK-type signal peptide-containing protein, partial [Lactobacillus iners]|nr:YSIRK-type signal peptide-containing protein [Lactobacillus iners]
MKKERLDKFSIRKLTVGAASVLIGVAFGATTVSAAAKPAPQQDTPASQQAAEVTELKGVKFTFKMGDKSATTRAVTIYATKDGHYGFEKDAAKCTSTAAQIVSTFLDSVSDDAIKNAQGVAYPEKIVAGENTVELAAQHASNKVEHSDADLQKEAEKKAEELQNQFAEEAKKAALAEAKKAAHKALNDAGITGAIFHKAIDNATTVEGIKAYVAEFTYHFTYKGAETTVSTDYVAGSVDKAEQYFRAYASESGLNLDFTYDEATHTFVGTDAKPAKTVYHFQYDDKKGNSIRQDFATTSKDTAEMHFRAYASDNALSIDDAHFTYNEATHTFVYKDFESEKGEPEVQPEAPVQKIVFHFQYDDKKGTSIRQDFAAVNKEIAEMHFKEYATESGLVLDDAHFAYNEANQTFVYKDFESEKGEPEVLPAPAVDVLAEAKKVAHEEFTKAGITGKIFHDA